MPKSFIYNSNENKKILALYRNAAPKSGEDDLPKAPDWHEFEKARAQQGLLQKGFKLLKAYSIGQNEVESVGLDYIPARSEYRSLFSKPENKAYATLYDFLYTYQQQKKNRFFGSN